MAVGVTKCGVAGSFGMWHHTKNIAFTIADAGYIANRPIVIGCGCNVAVGVAVSIDHLTVRFHFIEQGIFGKIPALAMCDGDLQSLVCAQTGEVNILAKELLIDVSQ